MPIKLGTTNIILPYSKAYLGSDLVYQKSGGYVDTEFTECPFPTEWTEVEIPTKYTATNEYGAWNIEANDAAGENYVKCAFDGDFTNNSCWNTKTTPAYIWISLPNNVFISPKIFRIRYRSLNEVLVKNSKIQGYNPETSAWENLVELNYQGNSAKTYTYEISSSAFYSKFRVECYRNTAYAYVYAFEVQEGTIRKYT